jgi:hypothetical protein
MEFWWILQANQLMKPAATEFFPDKPYSQQRFVGVAWLQR